jgi:hypothetical protein
VTVYSAYRLKLTKLNKFLIKTTKPGLHLSGNSLEESVIPTQTLSFPRRFRHSRAGGNPVPPSFPIHGRAVWHPQPGSRFAFLRLLAFASSSLAVGANWFQYSISPPLRLGLFHASQRRESSLLKTLQTTLGSPARLGYFPDPKEGFGAENAQIVR